MTDFLAVLGAALSIVVFLPQVVRAFRVGVEGISAFTYQLLAACLLMWVVYDAHRHYWTAIAGPGGMLLCSLLVLFRIFQIRRNPREVLPVFAAAVILAILLGELNHFGAIGWIAASLTVVTPLPQLREVFVDAKIEGVSALTWALSATTAAVWILFGIYKHDVVVTSANIVSLVVSSAIAIETTRRRKLQTHNSDNTTTESVR